MSEPDRTRRLRSVVSFLYGVADRSWLPGAVLLQLLVDVGATEDQARRTLARMRADGSLGTERRGRETDYQLAGLVRVADWRARAAGDPDRFAAMEQPVWEGAFSGLLYAVPKADRQTRNRLRRSARRAGYAMLRPGLMIGVRSGWNALAEVVSDLPAPAYAHPVTLGMKTDDARRAAGEAWRLDRAASRIEAAADRLAPTLREPGEDVGASALRSYVGIALPAYRLLVKIPTLPNELEPDGWPITRMTTALTAARASAGAAAQTYVDELLSKDRQTAEPASVEAPSAQ